MTAATTATPPTTPPAIAPVFVFDEDVGVEDAVPVVIAVADVVEELVELPLGVVHMSIL